MFDHPLALTHPESAGQEVHSPAGLGEYTGALGLVTGDAGIAGVQAQAAQGGWSEDGENGLDAAASHAHPAQPYHPAAPTYTLADRPDLFAQFLPSSSTFTAPSAPPSFVPSYPSQATLAHHALRFATSQPNFRAHPYARNPSDPTSRTLGRSISTSSFSYIPPGHFSYPFSADTSLSASTANTPFTPADVGASRFYELDPDTPSEACFGLADRTAFFSPTSDSLSLGGTGQAGQNVQEGPEQGIPPHLFMAGLPAWTGPAMTAAQTDVDDVWRGVRGGGLSAGVSDSDDEEEELEADEAAGPFLNLQQDDTSPADGEIRVDTDGESDIDVPLSQGRDRRLRAQSQVRTMIGHVSSSPMPVDVETPPSGQTGRGGRGGTRGRRGRGRGGARGRGIQAMTSRTIAGPSVRDPTRPTSSQALEVVDAGETEDELVELAKVDKADEMSLPGSPAASPLLLLAEETDLVPTAVSEHDLRDQTITLDSAKDSTLPAIIPTQTDVAEFHPSGRPKRLVTLRLAALPTVFQPDQPSSQEDGEDEISSGSSDIYATPPASPPPSSPKPSRATGQAKTVNGGKGKSEADSRVWQPEMWAKIDSLRGRLIGEAGMVRCSDFGEKMCQLLVDPRFAPEYITWNEEGSRMEIPDWDKFWTAVGPYVTSTMVKPSAFDKQLSNHGFKRETTGEMGTLKKDGDEDGEFKPKIASMIKRKSIWHPNLRRDDDELWEAVRRLPPLVKWGKNLRTSGSSSSADTDKKPDSARPTKRALRNSIDSLTAQLGDMQLERDKYKSALTEMRRMHPDLWTAKKVKLLGLELDEIPLLPPSAPTPSPRKRSSAKLGRTSTMADSDVFGPIAPIETSATPKITKKRSRAGLTRAAGNSVQMDADAGTESEAAKEGKAVVRKRSKLVLSAKN